MNYKNFRDEFLTKILETSNKIPEMNRAHWKRNNCVLTNRNGDFLGFGICTPFDKRVEYLKKHNLPKRLVAYEIYV